MRDYRQQTAGLRGAAKGLREIDMPKTAEQMEDAADAIEDLLRIGAKMHTWIFLHTTDEQAAYDEIGLTDEQNAMFGYSGQMILKAEPPKEVE